MAGNANLGTWQVGTLCFSYFMLFSYKNTTLTNSPQRLHNKVLRSWKICKDY